MALGLVLTTGNTKKNVELAARAEAVGFDSVFSVEFFNQNGFVVLGAVAEATRRVRIGTAIVNSFTRTPVLYATAAMDLDELSGGRMLLGLGSGTRRMNQDWYGVAFSKPAARMKELVRLLRALFAAQKGFGFRFEGRFWNLNIPAFTRPEPVRETIPICLAAVNEPMIRAAGTVADGLIGHPIASRRWHRERTLPALREAEASAGRPAGACRLLPYVLTAISDDREQAVRDAKNQIGFYFTVKIYRTILELHGIPEAADACRRALATFDVKAMADAIPDSLVEEIAIACPPDEARDRLRQWSDLGEEYLLYAPTIGIPPERVRDNFDAILDVFGTNG